MASRPDLWATGNNNAPLPAATSSIARIRVGKLDQALTEIRENLWTDPVIDFGSLTEYSQALFTLINPFLSHYLEQSVLATEIRATTDIVCYAVAVPITEYLSALEASYHEQRS